MKVILVDSNLGLVRLWRQRFKDYKHVTVYSCSFISLDSHLQQTTRTSAVVSPGNSFGWLGGGFDLALKKYFGGSSFEQFFRDKLGQLYKPVGAATVVDLGKWQRGTFRYIVHVPTIVAPSRPFYVEERPVETGYNLVFNVTWNALMSLPEDVDTLVIPGLGTGYVGVPEEVSSKSMEFAIRLFFARDTISIELMNAVIQQFLGYRFDGFISRKCLDECTVVGIDHKALLTYNVCNDPISNLLPSDSLLGRTTDAYQVER
ncbi:LADA_0G10572g1_1 [Lachancea dasiensis]|uniref:LADA_0G10572g1_1 n=1 Tax=Lachancea dasiensis TaxID=1072105 RepID=A0A1G4JUW8_9SACH|nr:LADA_0G10572g1_1 [Lachancea dasiensis]